MNPQDTTFAGGFSAPVFAAQTVFRALMEGMARPARVTALDTDAAAPAPACPALAAVALTLADHDTPLHLSPALLASALPAWLAFHTGAPLAKSVFDSAFGFFAEADGFPDLAGWPVGSDEYPDRSMTLVIEVPALDGGRRMQATGPGILEAEMLAPMGLPEGFAAQWRENQALYPRGVDLVLVSGSAFLCLPRTTRLTVLED